MMHKINIDDIAGPVIVIAPHPDDETLGCGGMIASLARRGTRVHTIFVTDGSSSHRNSMTWSPERLATQRQKEAVDALRALGAGAMPRTFLGLKDASMPSSTEIGYEKALGEMLAILEDLRPSHVLAPWRRDPHCDHRDAFLLITDAIRRSGQKPVLLEYAIWLHELGVADDFPQLGEVEVLEFAATDLVAVKRRAIAAHISQLGGLILDDASGFFLTEATLDRLITPVETYWLA